jgi:crotonobetainyl-CoA:carnitine CoA-transferase CaiB-like acyl-CoA transferase
VIGRPELARDPRYATNGGRVRNREALIQEVASILRTRRAGEWLEALEAGGVPCAPIRRMDEVFASPEGRGLLEDVDDPVRGALRLVASPILFQGQRSATRLLPPALGEHTEEVLSELERQG